MIKLNDYLYSGHTVLSILHSYADDLRADAIRTGNVIDLNHCSFLKEVIDLLEHNDFLTSQSQRIKEFYKYMAREYPFLAFTFRGRIKSLIRAEGKYNGYITDFIYERYNETGTYPTEDEIIGRLSRFHDLIAYRIVISIPKCNLAPGENREEKEIQYLYEIANALPAFLEERNFTAEETDFQYRGQKSGLDPALRKYYRDYVAYPKTFGYRSLHITFTDNLAGSDMEVQLRTKPMDDYAEIGPANHMGYEQRQDTGRARRDLIPVGECQYFDDAYERGLALQQLQLKDVDVNMFSAVDNHLINDGCGFYRGRLILPYEHLSRHQNDKVD